MDFQNMSVEEILAHADERHAFAQEVADSESPTRAQVREAEAALEEEQEAREAAAALEGEEAADDDAISSLREALATEDEEVEAAAEDVEEDAAEDETEEEEEAEEVEVEPEPAPVQARSRVKTAAGKAERPSAPALAGRKTPVITAAAEVPDFASGSKLDGINAAAAALAKRVEAFGTPSGTVDQFIRNKDGEAIRPNPAYVPDLRFAGVAKIALEFDDSLVIDRTSDHMSVLKHAADESRLPGKSLVAAGGWCTPSENLYDLCEGETLAGLVDIPEIQVRRGGINFTKGPDWAAFYAEANLGFIQTEAQAIAGTSKPCYELECPDWTDVRLDAVGLCLRVPILTDAAFPELTQRITRGAMVAHQHKVNASKIARMVTLAGAATAGIDWTTSAHSTLENLERIADIKRQNNMFDPEMTMEVVVPFWVRGAIRNDLALRGGRPLQAVTTEMIMAEFNARNLSPQFVYDWQAMDADTVTAGYPATFNALMYPAGTYVAGVADVINLNAVYDAASLATNVFTGLFFEEGLLVANTCWDADLVTINVCGSGHTGVADIDMCGADATP